MVDAECVGDAGPPCHPCRHAGGGGSYREEDVTQEGGEGKWIWDGRAGRGGQEGDEEAHGKERKEGGITQETGGKGQSRHSKFIWSNNSHNFHVNQNKK